MQRVLRNAAWGLISEGVGGALFFLAFVLTARHLGTFQFGIFSFVLAFVGVFQVVADFGLTNILVRDMARDPAHSEKMLGAAALLMALCSLGLMLAMICLSYWWAASREIFWACILMGASVVLTLQAAVLASVCRAHEDMGYNAAGNVAHKFLILVFVLIALHRKAGLGGIALAFLLAGMCQYLYFHVIVRSLYFATSWRTDPGYWRYLFAQSYLLGVAMICRRSITHVGTLLLGVWAAPYAVGLYNAAFRIIHVIDMLPFTLSIPLFPQLSRLAHESSERMFQFLRDALRFYSILSIPLCLSVFLLARPVITLTFGEAYIEAVPALQVMSAVIVLIFPTGLYIYAFSAINRQKSYAISTATCLATNFLTGVMLIPHLGQLGAALGIVAGELAFFLCGYLLLRREGFRMALMATIGKPLLATAIASPSLLAASMTDSLAVLALNILGFGAGYLLLIVLLRSIGRDELALVRGTFQPRPES